MMARFHLNQPDAFKPIGLAEARQIVSNATFATRYDAVERRLAWLTMLAAKSGRRPPVLRCAQQTPTTRRTQHECPASPHR